MIRILSVTQWFFTSLGAALLFVGVLAAPENAFGIGVGTTTVTVAACQAGCPGLCEHHRDRERCMSECMAHCAQNNMMCAYTLCGTMDCVRKGVRMCETAGDVCKTTSAPMTCGTCKCQSISPGKDDICACF